MVGWKRIVVTVGEKIGKEHLTYAQGACAELVAMLTISAADNFGLPVSHHPRAQLRRGRHHGRQQERIAVVHHQEHRHGVGLYAARSGAALAIVARLAFRWGVDPCSPGKRVWFTLANKSPAHVPAGRD